MTNMGKYISSSFLKRISKNIDDCSNPVQLRVIVVRYQNYFFDNRVKSIFKERLEFFKDWFRHETMYLDAIEDLEEEIELNHEISKQGQLVSNNKYNNNRKLVRSFLVDDEIFVDDEDRK